MHNIVDWLAFRAAVDPQATAVCSPARRLDFSQLQHAVRAVAARLHAAGVRPGEVVTLSVHDSELHWITTLGLFHVGAISCALGKASWPAGLQRHHVLSQGGELPGSIAVDWSWAAAETARAPAAAPHRYAPGEPARLVLTSGTTGEKKGVAVTHAQCVARAQASFGTRGPQKVFSMLSLSTSGGFNAALTGLMMGAPQYSAPSIATLITLVRQERIRGIYGSPFGIAGLLDALETVGAQLPVHVVPLAGGAVSPTLLARISRLLTSNVLVLYGSTEAGGTCAWRPRADDPPEMVGVPQPGVELQVVDDAGQAVAPGEVGRIRVRTPTTATGYFMREAQGAGAFQDGWFLPGDLGAIDAGGRLVLQGRADDVLNLPGGKLQAAVIDEFVRGLPGVRDAAAFRCADARGKDVLAIAVVAGPDVDLRALLTPVAERFRQGPAGVWLVPAGEIPRTETGKVRRALLSQALDGKLNRG